MKPIEIIATDLFEKVRSRFTNLQLGDESGSVTADPSAARFFDFDFAIEGNNLGRVSISINETGNLKIYYSQGIMEDADAITQTMWYDFLKEMRFFAKRRLLRFDTRDITKGNLDKTDFQYLAQNGNKDPNMNESKLTGSKLTSHRKLDNTDLIIRHSEEVDETKAGARSRKIKNLFIQNAEGERFKFPFIYLPGARAMQRHVANGGYPHDEAGKHIIKTCEEILKLSDFGRKVKHSSMNPNAHGIIEQAGNKLKKLRHHMECMGKQGYYESWKETYVPKQAEDDLIELDDATMESYKDAFTINKFDEALAEVFPLLHSIMQEAGEIDLDSVVSEAQQDEEIELAEEDTENPLEFAAFESWATSLEEGTLEPDALMTLKQFLDENPGQALGADGTEAIEALEGIGIVSDALEALIHAKVKMQDGANIPLVDVVKEFLMQDDPEAAQELFGQPQQAQQQVAPQPQQQPAMAESGDATPADATAVKLMVSFLQDEIAGWEETAQEPDASSDDVRYTMDVPAMKKHLQTLSSGNATEEDLVNALLDYDTEFRETIEESLQSSNPKLYAYLEKLSTKFGWGKPNMQESGPNKTDVPAYLRKQQGGDWKATTADLEKEKSAGKISHRDTLAKNTSESFMGPEDFQDWLKDATHRVAHGKVGDWTELAAELTSDLDMDDHKADIIAKRVFGHDKLAQYRVKPEDDLEKQIPTDGGEEDDDAAFLNKLRGQARKGSIQPGADTGEVDEDDIDPESDPASTLIEPEEESNPKTGTPEDIYNAIIGFLDKTKGTWTKGRDGLIAHCAREFGPDGGEKAKEAIKLLSKKYPMRTEPEDDNPMEDILRLAGLSSLAEAKKKSMSRAAKGWEKYGDGMPVLAKAGKEGASEKEMDAIRKKYNKYDESTGDYSAKKAAAGKDIGKPGKNFAKIEKSAGGGEKGKKIAGAVLAKLRKK